MPHWGNSGYQLHSNASHSGAQLGVRVTSLHTDAPRPSLTLPLLLTTSSISSGLGQAQVWKTTGVWRPNHCKNNVLTALQLTVCFSSGSLHLEIPHLAASNILWFPLLPYFFRTSHPLTISRSSITEKTGVSGHSERSFSGFPEKDSAPTDSLWLCMFLGMLKVNIYRNYFLHKKPTY